MKIRIFTAGYCTGPGKIADRSLPWRQVKFPAPFAAIQHPHEGIVLFDTGYHPRIYKLTQKFPEKLLALATPCDVSDRDTAIAKLAGIGISASDVSHLVLSHLHADHTAGLLDFKHAKLHSDVGGWEYLCSTGRFSRVRKGYITDLLPEDFEDRAAFISDYPVPVSGLLNCSGIPMELWCKDLFGDDLIYVVSLPGHARGHIGLLCRRDESWLFLLADACWLSDNLRKGHAPHPMAGLIFDDAREFKDTLNSLKYLYECAAAKIDFVPSHCKEIIEVMIEKGWM